MAACIHNGRVVLYKSQGSYLIDVGGDILDYNIEWVEFCCEPIDDDFIDQLQVANAVPIPTPCQNNWNSDLGRQLLRESLRRWTPALLPVEAEEAAGRAIPSNHHRFIHFFASDPHEQERRQHGEPSDNARVAAMNNCVWGTMESFPNGAICRLYAQPDLPPRQPLPIRRPDDYDDDDLESRLEWTLRLLELQESQLKTICDQPGADNETFAVHDEVHIHSSLLPGRRYDQVQYGDAKKRSIRDLFARALDLASHNSVTEAQMRGWEFFNHNVPREPSTCYHVGNNNCIDYAIKCWNLLQPSRGGGSEEPIVLDYEGVHRHDGFNF